ncbi:MAG: ATP-dependent DNA helicase UvrD2 [Acidimicrobiales bacterium]|nr:ATP-dependent DNA helicase UvrD2 [Acidimicrobiales bacterium]
MDDVAPPDTDELLDGLTPAQRVAVVAPDPSLAILAGAGTGKTRVLTRRIAHRSVTGDLDPRRVLALTFTRKAAQELQDRLRRLGLRDHAAAGTFHAVAFAQLRSRWAERGVRPPVLLDRPGGLLARVAPRALSPEERSAVVAEVAWARARTIVAEQYPRAAARARRSPPLDPAQMAQLLTDFQTEKRRRRVVDFDDLLELAARDLRDDEAYAEARRWRFRHVFVDEFQDINALQFELLRAWIGPDPDLCVVGDTRQAIYAWNGADPSLLDRIDVLLPGTRVLELQDNFRSTPQILAAAHAVSGKAEGLVAHRPDGPAPTVSEHSDEHAEAAAVARRIRDRHTPGTPWSRQAVLVRTNAQLSLIAAELERCGIPHRLRGAQALARSAVVVAWLDDFARSSAPIASVVADLRAAYANEPSDELGALVSLAESSEALDPTSDAAVFAAWAGATLRGESIGWGADAVDLCTFHAAKGLEWPIVHLAGVEDGYVPLLRGGRPGVDDEERRLFYVAVTRAEHELHVTWARERRLGQRVVRRAPSPWLEHLDGIEPPATSPGRLRLDRSSRPRRSTSDPVVQALHDWRAAAARRAGVLPGAVLSDRSLSAIAECRPGTVDELAELPGIGAVKAARFGAELVALVSGAGPGPDLRALSR